MGCSYCKKDFYAKFNLAVHVRRNANVNFGGYEEPLQLQLKNEPRPEFFLHSEINMVICGMNETLENKYLVEGNHVIPMIQKLQQSNKEEQIIRNTGSVPNKIKVDNSVDNSVQNQILQMSENKSRVNTNAFKNMRYLKGRLKYKSENNLKMNSKKKLSSTTTKENRKSSNKNINSKTRNAKLLKLKYNTKQNNLKKLNQMNKLIDLTINTKKEEKKKYYCRECKSDNKLTVTQLREHYEMVHNISRLIMNRAFVQKCVSKTPRIRKPDCHRCEVCSNVFDNKEKLNAHYSTHEDQFTCDVCNLGFKMLIDYIFHAQTHNPDKLYCCTLCGKTSEKASSIKYHLYYVHEHFKKFKCEICGKGFHMYDYLLQHMNTHTGAKPYQCEECGISFAILNNLKHHQMRRHKDDNKNHTCPICEKVYPSRLSVRIHCRTIHQPPTSCVCDVCGKTFEKPKALVVHKKTHSKPKLHKCGYCEKSFRIKAYKTEHERTHTGEKPFICPYCKKGFSQRTSMVRHSRMHGEAKVYICNFCNQKFYFKNEIIRHFENRCRRQQLSIS